MSSDTVISELVSPRQDPGHSMDEEESNTTRVIIIVLCSLFITAIVGLSIIVVVLVVRRQRKRRRIVMHQRLTNTTSRSTRHRRHTRTSTSYTKFGSSTRAPSLTGLDLSKHESQPIYTDQWSSWGKVASVTKAKSEVPPSELNKRPVVKSTSQIGQSFKRSITVQNAKPSAVRTGKSARDGSAKTPVSSSVHGPTSCKIPSTSHSRSTRTPTVPTIWSSKTPIVSKASSKQSKSIPSKITQATPTLTTKGTTGTTGTTGPTVLKTPAKPTVNHRASRATGSDLPETSAVSTRKV